jgi:phage-related tail protein
MGLAFEISEYDIITAAERLGLNISEEEAETIMEDLDEGIIEKEALRGEDLDEQTEYAIQEIMVQINELKTQEALPAIKTLLLEIGE